MHEKDQQRDTVDPPMVNSLSRLPPPTPVSRLTKNPMPARVPLIARR